MNYIVYYWYYLVVLLVVKCIHEINCVYNNHKELQIAVRKVPLSTVVGSCRLP